MLNDKALLILSPEAMHHLYYNNLEFTFQSVHERCSGHDGWAVSACKRARDSKLQVQT